MTLVSERTTSEITPLQAGFRMPARFDRHDRTIVTWPPREEGAHSDIEGFRSEVEALVKAVAQFEPVMLLVDPKDEADATTRCDGYAEIVVMPIDACWIRDNGPIFVRDSQDRVAGVHFDFNGWGGRMPAPNLDVMPSNVAMHLGMHSFRAPFICEGGGISVDGDGTLITNEQVMRNLNRYRDVSRDQVENYLHDYLGIEQVIWLELGLVEDTETDGHIDNVVEYVASGVVLAQTVTDKGNPNYDLLQENLRHLKAARDAKGRALDIIELDILPYLQPINGRRPVAPYVNAYVCNGGIIAPEVDPKLDEAGYRILEEVFPGRRVVPVPCLYQADGGGGVACLTQQVPEGIPAVL